MAKTIPEIRERLLEIALHPFLPPAIGAEIKELAEATKRRPAVRRVGPRQEFTDEKRKAVIAYATAFPEESYHEIARALDVNTARISETLAGKRDATPGS